MLWTIIPQSIIETLVYYAYSSFGYVVQQASFYGCRHAILLVGVNVSVLQRYVCGIEVEDVSRMVPPSASMMQLVSLRSMLDQGEKA